jgi:hypothetical protein
MGTCASGYFKLIHLWQVSVQLREYVKKADIELPRFCSENTRIIITVNRETNGIFERLVRNAAVDGLALNRNVETYTSTMPTQDTVTMP